MTDVVFLTGHRKSGTTMLFRLFDGHPEANIYPPDLSLFYAYFPRFARSLCDADSRDRIALVVRKSFDRVFRRMPDGAAIPEHMYAFSDILAQSLSAEALRDRALLLQEMLNLWTDFAKLDPAKPMIVKETSQVGFLNSFVRAPALNIKMISLVRDPRDNYAALKSGVEKYYSKMAENGLESLASAINRIKFDFQAANIARAQRPGSVRALRFEDLVQDPEGEMREVSDFLGLDFDRKLLEPTVFGYLYSGNNHDGKRFAGISSDHLAQWNQRISPTEAQIIEFWLANEMEIFGYRPQFSMTERLDGYAQFYDWYNDNYFYRDSFAL